MKTVDFGRGKWENDPELTYAYSFRFAETPEFVQMDDHVVNRKVSEAMYGYDNISLMTRGKYGPGTKLTACCDFEELGAPLIVVADELHKCPDGVMRYGEYCEIVLYKGGINVWRMHMIDGEVKWKKELGVFFPVSQGEKHTFSVKVNAENFEIETEGHKMLLRVENLPQSFHLGINACEGINRFYSMTIE